MMTPKKPKFSEAQRKQRALYKAQSANPPKGERTGQQRGIASSLHRDTGLRVTR